MSKKYLIIAGVGIAIWLTETAAFGFNAKPQSGLEATLDALSQGLIIWGVIGDILNGITVVKKHIINTDDMTYVDQRGRHEKTNLTVPKRDSSEQ